MLSNYELKTYMADESCVFKKTKELYGGLSNMASGFPLNINNFPILTSEALFQACRFPNRPDLQEKIITQKSPMSAKMVTKPFRQESRPDWEDTKVEIMWWCLRIKLAQNTIEFGRLLDSTSNKTIVEDSRKIGTWGAKRDKADNNILTGRNVLGYLLVELRQFYFDNRNSEDIYVVEPLKIPDFKIYGNPIKTIKNE